MLTALSNSALSNYFLDPAWVLALAALIPLIIFYLVKPKPDEKMMPSIRFFMKDRKEGRIKQAISKILQNLMLIFHILFVIAVVAAVANPFINGPSTADRSVVVIDNSASMEGSLEDAKNFAVDRLGGTNTVILVNDDVKVIANEATRASARRAINNVELEETPTDLARALQISRNYRGQLVLASDTDHTASSRETTSVIQNIKANREVYVMDAKTSNSWGFADLNVKESWVEVKNYDDSQQQVNIELDGTAESVTLQPGEARRVDIDLEKGENTVSLPEDGMAADNTLSVYRPEQSTLEVAVIADSENRYLMKAFELINQTDPEFYQSPIESFPSADVYVIGQSENTLSQTVNSVENRVQNGATAVVMANEGLEPEYYDHLPVENIGERTEANVEFRKPRKINIGNTEVYNLTVTGRGLSDPQNALVHGTHGQGDILVYNINDEDFRRDFLYPVFWRNVVDAYSEVKDAEDLNLETGQTVRADGKPVELNRTGFHELGGQKYTANLLNDDESSTESSTITSSESATSTVPKSIQNLAALLVLLLALTEAGYLYYIGDMQ
ncbi:vWA domain-containing protein [Candidatus Nanohalovita haloferacivicina]|uniref:vWA domain-containing protein n=1 Tax=Candidatus Nanohalovita haloferacivicina TaxID=2978046 RepID=UPI00325FD8C7|nr:vWFA domain containing protein [Candidatus Nanohalobia archaeon BNXNv]